jgi:hypothetical protein
MTRAEQAEVARLKAEPAGDCTTTPAFIDSATRLFQGNFDNRLTVRLSAYKTPGCNGHLSTIYLLDVLRGDALMRTSGQPEPRSPLIVESSNFIGTFLVPGSQRRRFEDHEPMLCHGHAGSDARSIIAIVMSSV